MSAQRPYNLTEKIKDWSAPLNQEHPSETGCTIQEVEDRILKNKPCHLKVILLTPILGGGFHAANEGVGPELLVDPNTPIRPSEVRGHLRFWWRMLKPGVRKPVELLAEEEAIFGGPSAESGKGKARGPNLTLTVDVPWSLYINEQVQHLKKPDSRRIVLAKQAGKLVPPFVAWPFADKLATFYLKGRIERNAFDMSISFRKDLGAEQAKEFSNALRLWLWLGGVGARVRRGAGAVIPSGFWTEEDWGWLVKKVNGMGARAKASPPHLQEVRRVQAPPPEDMDHIKLIYEYIFLAWYWAADTYKKLLSEEFPSKKREEQRRAALGAPFPWAKTKGIRDVRLASPIIFRPAVIDGEVYILVARLKNLDSQTSCGIGENEKFVHDFYEKFVSKLESSRPEKLKTEGSGKKRKARRKRK